MLTEHLRPVDLALLAAKKRQSPRTGFVHFFYGHEGASDTIALYENFCYALALLRSRKVEAILEAKDLLLRLLSFQTAEGNFPLYLHDYPRCFHFLQGLKIAPLFLLILRASAIEQIAPALQRIMAFYAEQKRSRTLPPVWEYRYQMCKAVLEGSELPSDTLDKTSFSEADWWEYWVTKQFEETPSCDFYHEGLGLCLGPFLLERAQEGTEPWIALIDWICAEAIDTPRLLKDHPAQIGLAALEDVRAFPATASSFALLSDPGTGHWDLLWKGESMHRLSLHLQSCNTMQKTADTWQIELPCILEREDLFELAFYVDASPEIRVSIGGLKGTSFALGDWIQICAENASIAIRFTLLDGQGDFCGHIYRSNRPNQRLNTNGASFDWKIGLRTLRRTEKCRLSVQVVRAGAAFE